MKGSKKPKTPRPYLSWSQFNMFQRDPETYRRVYILGEKDEPTDAMMLGSRLSEALEDGMEDSDDPMIAHGLIYLPKYPKREYPLRARVGGIPLCGKLDGYDPRTRQIGEYKCGRTKWNQKEVDRCKQLTFYYLMYTEKFKREPQAMFLHWLNSDSGMVTNFATKRSTIQKVKLFQEIQVVWEGINKMCNE